MKIKRLLAAILSAMMIISCFSFTANAQETQTVTGPVAYYTAKGSHGSFRTMGGLTKTRMYDAVNDVVFYHHTDIPDGSKHYDAYGLGTVPVKNGLIYFAADIRTNFSAKPNLNVYGATITGSDSNSGGNFAASSNTKADGTWERVVIKIENANLTAFNQNHIMLLGSSKPTGFTGDKYLDVAVFGYFNDEYSAMNYDFGTVTAPNGAASFSVDGVVTDEVPTEDPEIENGFFMGWSADEDAKKGDAITALSKVPDADTTYYAITTGLIEDETAVYLSSSGDDANSGRHSKTPVKTLTKANEILAANDGLTKLVIVGTFTTTYQTDYTIGVAGKTITVTGADSSAVFDYDARKGGSDDNLFFNGPIIFENIAILEGSGDGRMRTRGHTVKFGEGVVAADGNGIDIAPTESATSNTYEINSGKFSRIYPGGFSDGNSFSGTSNITINEAEVDTLGLGWGYNSQQAFSGTFNAEINGGKIQAITLDSGKPAYGSVAASYGYQSTNSYRGLRYYTLNGGTVGNIITTSKATYGNEGANTASYRTGVTVFEINKAGIIKGNILLGRDDDASTRIVLFNNGSFESGKVTDSGAIVVDVKGGAIQADVTVAADYTATLNGFTYDLDYNYYNAVEINGEVYDLANYETLPASLFDEGVNTVEFYEVDSAPFTTLYVSDSGDDANKGDTAEAPVKTMKKVRELIDADGSVIDTVYLVGTVTITKDDATASRPSISIGASDSRKMKYLGYGEDAILDARLMPVYLVGEVELDNFTFHQQTTYDGKLMAEGHNITIGEDMKFGGYDEAPANFELGGGTSTKLTNFYYALKGNSGGAIDGILPIVNTLTVNGGKIASLQPAVYSGDATFKGEVTVNVNDSAKITSIESEVGGNSIGNYSGLREININGGTVGTIKTTAKASSTKGTATKREQLMVITVNGGTVNAITKPVDDEDEKSQIVVIFNDGVAPVAYTDSEAYILNVTGGNVEAVTTVSEDYTTATLNKFTFTLPENSVADTVRIGEDEYAIAELGGEIALDKLTKGTVNEIEFFYDYNDPAHVADYRADGYEIVYVASAAKGTGDGSTAENAKAYSSTVMQSVATGEKGVFVFVDQISISGITVNAGATVVITENDDEGIFYFEGSVGFTTRSSTSTAPTNIIFDNIHILHNNGSATGERILNAGGNNLTFTDTVTSDSSSFPGEGPLNIHAGLDGTTTIANSTGEINITLNGGSRMEIRSGGWGGSKVNAKINYVVGGNAQVKTLQAGGHSANSAITEADGRTQNGDVTITVKDNAVINKINATNRGILNGNIVVNIQGGEVKTVAPSSGAEGAVNGNITLNVTGGKLGEITAKHANISGLVTANIDLDNVTLTGPVDASVGYIIAHKGDGTFAINDNEGVKTLALTPGENVKYIRVTNGDTVKEYNVAGDEVTLLADLSALPLSTGLTTVEFLADGTEAPKTASYTIAVYTMGTDGEYAIVETTATAAIGDTVTYTAEEKTGFTVNDESILSGEVTADGSLVLKVIYDRNQYDLKTKADADADEVTVGTYYYGEAVTAPVPPEKSGFTFKGWNIEVPATMPAGDVTLTATWEEIPADEPIVELNSLAIWTYFSDSTKQGTDNSLRGWGYDAIAQRPYMYHTHDGSENEMFIRNDITEATAAAADDMTVKDSAVYAVMDIRTTVATTPKLTLVEYVAGGETATEWREFYASDTTKGNGEWERVLIRVGRYGAHRIDNLTEIKKFNIAPLGNNKTGATVDIFGLAFFDDEEIAEEYVLSARPNVGTYSFTVDGETVTPDAANAPEKDGYTFKGWAVDGTETVYQHADLTALPIPAQDTVVNLSAIFDETVVVNDKVYLSDNGDDTKDGLTAATAVKTIAKAMEIMAADEELVKLVIVDKFTASSNANDLGVAGRTITITGNTSAAVFSIDWPAAAHVDGKNTDDKFTMVGPVVFDNIAITGDNNDGRITTNGHKLVFGAGVTNAVKTLNVAVETNTVGAEIEINGGKYDRVFPGKFSGGTFTGSTTITVDGDNTVIGTMGIGHGWNQSQNFSGTYNAIINGGTITKISLQSGGVSNNADNGYRGLRYFTINDGTVENIVTTSSLKFKNGSSATTLSNVAYREGVTVFEINKAGIVTGTIDRGINIDGKEKNDDNATRIILFNNGSYEAGKVLDAGAITVDVQNGAIKADVTVGADGYTTTLNGYTFTTDKTYVTINGTKYTAAELAGVIPADKLTAGENTVIFSDADIVEVKWVINGETVKNEILEVGAAVAAPAAPAKAPTKDYYYTFKAWNDGTADIDPETYTAPAGGATLTAVYTETEMPASATHEYITAAAPNNVADFSVEVATIDGVEAVKITPNADVTEDSIRVEGWEQWPLNKSYPGNEKYVDTGIYPYVAVRYYYVPGTLEGATTGFWINSNNTFEGNNGTSIDAPKVAAEAGKWTYVVYDISATNMANKISRQYWVRALAGATVDEMSKAGAHIYLDTLTIYKDAPTVATVTFKGEDGTALYTIDAINSEAVTYNGTAPEKADYTFKGWAIEGTTTVVEQLTFAADTTLVPVFEKNAVVVPEGSAAYKTYGVYDEATGTYTIEIKLSGVEAHMGSFGFAIPGAKTVTANTAAGISLFAEEAAAGAVVSPIFVNDDNYYANTWAVEVAPGYIDATEEEILIATIVVEADGGMETLDEYVIANADAKYHNGTNYLVAPKADSLDTDKIPVIHASHTDTIKEIPEAAIEYNTYANYNPATGEYVIDVKVKGGKINLGAFGIAFNSEYMTYDPDAENALVLADGISNYLGVTLANTADGVAFVWDGSANEADGYIDATEEEILIATITATMTAEQRQAYVDAGTPAFEVLDISNVEDTENYFDGTDYLVTVYEDDLAVERVAAKYVYHSDTAIEITTADVTIKVNFTAKEGATVANIGYITVDDGEAVVIDGVGNEEAVVEYVIEDANVGETLTIKIEKNGYVPYEAEVTVTAAGANVEIDMIPGDIKGTTEALAGDGEVSLDDFIRIVRAFEDDDSNAMEAYRATVDINENGTVDVTDLGFVKANFGATSADYLAD